MPVSSFSDIGEKYFFSELSYIFNLVRDQGKAELLCKEVFKQAEGDLQFRSEDVAISDWIRMITRSVLEADALSCRSEDYDEIVLQGLSGDDINTSLPWLAKELSEVLRLRFVKGCNLEETAMILGVQIKQVRALEHEGLTFVRNEKARSVATEVAVGKKLMTRVELYEFIEGELKRIPDLKDRRIIRFYYGIGEEKRPNAREVFDKFKIDKDELFEIIEDFELGFRDAIRDYVERAGAKDI